MSATLRANRYGRVLSRVYAAYVMHAGTHERTNARTHERTRIGGFGNARIPHPKAKFELLLDKHFRIVLECKCRQNDTVRFDTMWR